MRGVRVDWAAHLSIIRHDVEGEVASLCYIRVKGVVVA